MTADRGSQGLRSVQTRGSTFSPHHTWNAPFNSASWRASHRDSLELLVSDSSQPRHAPTQECLNESLQPENPP